MSFRAESNLNCLKPILSPCRMIGLYLDKTEKKWWRDRDLNPRRGLTLAGFQDRCIQPLCHPSDEMDIIQFVGAIVNSSVRTNLKQNLVLKTNKF